MKLIDFIFEHRGIILFIGLAVGLTFFIISFPPTKEYKADSDCIPDYNLQRRCDFSQSATRIEVTKPRFAVSNTTRLKVQFNNSEIDFVDLIGLDKVDCDVMTNDTACFDVPDCDPNYPDSCRINITIKEGVTSLQW